MAKQAVIFTLRVEDIGLAARIEQTRQDIRSLNSEIRKNPGPERFKEIAGQLSQSRREMTELLKQQRALNQEFQALKVPKDSLAGLRLEYSKLAREVANLSAAERKTSFGQNLIKQTRNVKGEIDSIEQSLGRFTGNVGNYKSALGVLGRAFAALGIGASINEIVGINTKISDSIANVAKTAGIAVSEAQQLSDALELRNTRTSLLDQLQIAEIGAQLGVARDQLQKFTEGVDVLNVAVGSRFGNVEELTRVVSSLRNVFTDIKTDNVPDDILKIGNALNYLETQGVATAPIIAEFSGRIAGTAIPLGISTKQVVGLSTALAELAITPERGATAISQLFLKIAQEPEKFATVTGKSAKEFRKIVETDLFGALKLVAKGTSEGAATNVEFAKSLEDLGIGRQGAIEALGKLGGNLELLDKRTQTAGETLSNTNSIMIEYEKKNNNAAAAVAKLQNAVISLVASEGAQDAIEAVAKAVTVLIQTLGDALALVSDNKEEFLALGAAIFAMANATTLQNSAFLKLLTTTNLTTAAGLKNVVAMGAQTVATNIQTVATNLLAAAQAAMPLLALVAGIYLVVKAVQSYNEGFTAAEKASRAVADAQGDIAEKSASELASLNASITVLQSVTSSQEDRTRAIKALVEQYPEYLKGINLEIQTAGQLAIIQQELTDQIIRRAAAQAKADAQAKISADIVKSRLKLDQLRKDQAEGKFTFQDREFIIRATELRLESLDKQLQETGKQFDDVFKLNQAPESRVLTIVDPKSLNQQIETAKKGANQLTDDEKKARDKAAKERKKADDDKRKDIEAQQARIREIQKSIRDLTLGDEEGFSQKLQALENQRIDALEKNAQRLEQLRTSIRERTGTEAPTTTGGIRQLPNARPADITEADLIDQENVAINAAFTRQRKELETERNKTADAQRRQLEALLNEAQQIAADNEVKIAQGVQQSIELGFDKQRDALKRQFLERKNLEEAQLQSGQITEQQFQQQQLVDTVEYNNRLLAIEVDHAKRVEEIAGQVRDIKIAAAQAALDAELAAIEDRRVQAIDQATTTAKEQGTTGAPLQNQISAINEKAAREAESAQIQFADTVKKTTADAEQAQLSSIDAVDSARQGSHEAELARIAEEEANRKRIKDAAIDAAGEIASSLIQIQQNRLQQETAAEIEAVEAQYKKKIDNAKGNAALQAKLQKDLDAKKDKIQKEAAAKEQRLAIIQAVINTALAVTKALSSASPPVNFILAALSLAAGIAQIAVIKSQQFAEGGFAQMAQTKAQRKRTGRTKTAVYPISVWESLPTMDGGGYTGGGLPYTDTTGRPMAGKLSTSGSVVHAGEYVAPASQVARYPELFNTLDDERIRLARPFAFGGYTATSTPVFVGSTLAAGGFDLAQYGAVAYLRPMQSGGFADPFVGLPNSQEFQSQAFTVNAQANFSEDQIGTIGNIIAAEIAKQIKPALAEGIGDANRRLEREQSLSEQRTF